MSLCLYGEMWVKVGQIAADDVLKKLDMREATVMEHQICLNCQQFMLLHIYIYAQLGKASV